MKIKALSAAVALVSFAAGAAHAATPSNQQLQLQLTQLKTQQQQLHQQIAGLEGTSPSHGLVHVGPVGGMMIANNDSDGHGLSLMKAIAKAGKNAPLLTIGGTLEADAQYNTKGNTGGNTSVLSHGENSGSDIYIDTARLYFLAHVNNWVNGEMSYTLNSTARDKMHTGSLLFGNLNQFPIYLQIGKFYPNAGIFSLASDDVYSQNLVIDYFRPDAKAGAALNFYKAGLHTSLTVYKQGTNPTINFNNTRNSKQINDFAAQADYTFTTGQVTTTLGAGYVNNIVGANGSLGVKGAGAESGATSTYNGYARLPMANISGKVSIGPSFDILATYAQTLKSVNHADGSNNKLKVYDIEGAYHFHAMKKLMTATLGYSATKNFNDITGIDLNNGLGAKKDQWLVGISSEVLKNTTIGLEYARDRQYTTVSTSDTHNYNVITADMTVKF